MPSIVELKQERERLIHEARTMIQAAEGANRDLDGEERQAHDRLNEEIASLTSRAERQERLEQIERDAAGPTPPGDTGPGSRGSSSPDDDLNEQFRALARGERSNLEVDFTQAGRTRDLTTGTNAAGGATVPNTFVAQLYEYLTETSAIRQTNVTVRTTGSGEAMQFPKVAGKGTAGLVSEGAAIPEGDPSFGQVTLGAHKYGQLLQLSSELIADSGVNILDFIARDAGHALGEATGAHYINGDGSSKPTGILQDTTAGVTAASATEVTADELISLFFSVNSRYRRNSYWMMNDSTLAHIATLKDGAGRYLIDPITTSGITTMRGRPVVTDPNIPELGAGAKSIIFGDFSTYYIRDVGSMRFERSNEYAFGTDLVSFRSIMRTDGKLVDTTGSVKHLVQAAA